ncbi:glucose-inhibited division protein A [Desulfosporosinus orientis DSM 765]|uniref:tRNA uridine 5-carboxymethylaminomethyl modification enzyme MnmG n=1 Tax=Desulfosporosinus orientis (strain ATCC 19365 / DSM 765 / NCIMB 8382 / VKM B-1628 / Singapore I) TaxID=768706 RepID=G7WI78_DESOD|nr:tRNA uridine-5-carboxymethylaminomethyl(34) synthesis enzyme MnmG [Desulfosporosinus orientis]AET71001.1 glucose-inhibited division protein A [Desulfosporosinus orientis DSM 765]
MEYFAGKYDVIVVGAGHAGCEAALAAARIGCETLLLTLNLDTIAHMPCNPSLGGPAKGHLVREIDALGGQMGIVADETSLQAKMLNTGKGPAVHALRVQSDKLAYQSHMRNALLSQPRLTVIQGLVERLDIKNNSVCGVVTRTGARFESGRVVLTSGTYLRGRIIIGDSMYQGGPNGQMPAVSLSDSLKEYGIELGRFKTGTPPRIQRQSVDFSKFRVQPGDDFPWRFSFLPTESKFWHGDPSKQVSCWLGYTGTKTHEIIRNNLYRAPLYSGKIEGVGPRYCPSIEDKVVRFSERDAHQIFLEPEGWQSEELYVAGLSTSMPEEVQIQILQSIVGLENVRMLRPGYAIEYDYVLPHQLSLCLEVRQIKGLFTAGQFNGTSGYEEAAAQGLIAGINAALQVFDKEPFILRRSDGYAGVLVDDLVTKGVKEPYRLLTSRAEYRLVLRQDNADLRLTEKGRHIGLVNEDRWKRYYQKTCDLESINGLLKAKVFSPLDEELQQVMIEAESTPARGGISAQDLIRRPEISLKHLIKLLPELENFEMEVLEEAEIEAKYSGYIDKQLLEIEKFTRLEEKILPDNFSYEEIRGLSTEGRQRLMEVNPLNLGQASRITGVSPADISVLLVSLEQKRRREK